MFFSFSVEKKLKFNSNYANDDNDENWSNQPDMFIPFLCNPHTHTRSNKKVNNLCGIQIYPGYIHCIIRFQVYMIKLVFFFELRILNNLHI